MMSSNGKGKTELLNWFSSLSKEKIFLTRMSTININIEVNSNIGEVNSKDPKFQTQMKDIWGP